MTLHLEDKSVICKKCEAVFIPYKKDFNCPKCGRLIPFSSERKFDFVEELIGTMGYHKNKYGAFMPPMWYQGSFTGVTQSQVYQIFDTLEHDSPENPKEYLKTIINRFECVEGSEYLRQHYIDICLAVYDIYKTDENLSRKTERPKLTDKSPFPEGRKSLIKKIKDFLW